MLKVIANLLLLVISQAIPPSTETPFTPWIAMAFVNT